MQLYEWVGEAEEMQKWHGLVYRDPLKRKSLCMIMPFNLIHRFVLSVIWIIKCPNPNRGEKIMLEMAEKRDESRMKIRKRD